MGTLSDYVQYAIELQKEVPLMNQMYEYEQELDPRMVLNDAFSENELHNALITPAAIEMPSFAQHPSESMDDDMSHLDVQSKHTAAHSSSEYFESMDIDPIEEEDSKVEMISPVNNQQQNLTIHVSPDSISDEDGSGGWVNNGYTPNTLASTPGSPSQKKKYKNYSNNVTGAIDDVKMYENESPNRLSIIVDEKTNFTR